MKANELMIGDWVKTNHCYSIVTRIGGEQDIYFEDKLGWGIASGVDPIPLTKEIFEKNGFDCSEREFVRLDFMDGDYTGHFSLRAMYENGPGAQRGWAFYAFNVLVVLDYVHEPQHAMRLCGIKQEIKL